MEASKFWFDLDMPPAFKFDPTDADIVAYYLLPRALNLHNPYARAIVEGDPTSAPPWEILQRCGDVAHAFFFGPPTDPSRNGGGRKNRMVKGGLWQGQRGTEDTVTLLRPGGGEVDIRYKRHDLSFCLAKRERTTGYQMREYEILLPPLPGTVLTRIKAPKSVKKQRVDPGAAQQQVPDPEQSGPSHEYEILSPPLPGTVLTRVKAPKSVKKQRVDPGAAQQQVADPEQPGPSHECDSAAMIAYGGGFAGAQDGALYGGGMVENAGYYRTPLEHYLPLVEYDNNNRVPIQDQPGTSYNYDAAAMNGEGFAGAQSNAFYGGGMVDTSGAYYDPSCGYVPVCGGDYSNYYGEYKQWQYQQDQSNYQAGDSSLMFADGEQQAGAPCGNSDNGSVYYGEYQQWQYQQDQSNQYQAGDASLMSADGEQQAGAPCGNSDNSSVVGTEMTAHSTNQQWQYQQDPSNQYQAGDDAVIRAGGEGFSTEEQAGALCGNNDSGSVVGTETSAHSAISLCGDGEVELDDASLYNLLFGDDDNLKCDQNGAGDPANELVI